MQLCSLETCRFFRFSEKIKKFATHVNTELKKNQLSADMSEVIQQNNVNNVNKRLYENVEQNDILNQVKNNM